MQKKKFISIGFIWLIGIAITFLAPASVYAKSNSGKPNILIIWEADEGEQVSFPVGLGIIRTTQWGKLPIRWGVEFQYYLIKPDIAGPQFNIKIFIVPVVPPAKFARSPLF